MSKQRVFLTGASGYIGSAVARHLVAAGHEVHGMTRSRSHTRALLAEAKGPSVSPLNGIIASLGAFEFMVAATGLRPPKHLLNFRGHLGKLTDAGNAAPNQYCEFCHGYRAGIATADVERYLMIPHLQYSTTP